MRIAMVAAEFTPDEADKLRRAMATFKFTQGVGQYHDKLVGGMTRRGYALEFPLRLKTMKPGSKPTPVNNIATCTSQCGSGWPGSLSGAA